MKSFKILKSQNQGQEIRDGKNLFASPINEMIIINIFQIQREMLKNTVQKLFTLLK